VKDMVERWENETSGMMQGELILLRAQDGAELRVHSFGRASTSTVLLCLPVGILPGPVQPLIDALSVQHRVLVSQSRWVYDDATPELVGTHAVHLDTHAADVEQITRDLQTGPVHLIGYCCGALIALAAAGRLGSAVRSLTLCNGAYALRPEASTYEQDILELASRYAWRPRLARVIFPVVSRKVVEAASGDTVDGASFAHHFTMFHDYACFLKYIQVIRGIFLESPLSALTPVSVPVLAVSGGRDHMTPSSQFDQIKQLCANATHVVLDEEDHYLPCRPGAPGIQRMVDFIRRHDPGPGPASRASRRDEGRAVVLSRADIARIFAAVGPHVLMDDAIRRLEEALRRYDPQHTEVKPRDGFRYREPHVGLVEWMTVHARQQDVVVKLVGYHPENPAHGLATVQATIARFSTQTGCIDALIEGSFATALRTGAASAIATRHCAAPGANVVGLVGCGAQAVTQLHALSRVMRIERVLVHDIQPSVRGSFVRRVAFLGLPIIETSLDQLERESDVICTATSVDVGHGPVISGRHLKSHVHLNAVGSDLPGKIELPRALLRASMVIPDFPEQALLEGECQQLSLAEIGPALNEVVQDPEPAARRRTTPTVFDSTGHPLEDRVALEVLLHHGAALGVGQRLDLTTAGLDPRDPYAF
jgi:ornithine cyclodeaminase/alanine dehydrogenase-like protein (mu-crystallin family)/pimeloyl-ACP methyl ester carboxylesterase